MIRRTLSAAVVVGALLAAPGPVGAQSSGGTLAEAERLVEEGRFAPARQLVEGWWNDRQEGASRRELQTAIWLRAVLTVEPDMADLDYRRLVVEFPGGPYSDEALLRLARGAEARGDLPAARRYLAILVRDYPGSPHRPEARTLLAQLPERAEGEAAAEADRADRGAGAAGESAVEPPAPQPDARGPERRIREAPAPEPRERGLEAPEVAPHTVQLGAFSTLEGAESLAARARDEGLQVRVVRVEGSDLFRVRLGGFRTPDGARERAAGIRDRGFDATISSDRDRERAGG